MMRHTLQAHQSVITESRKACEAWIMRTGSDPDFLTIPHDSMKDLREELRYLLRGELPSIDDMVRDAARGKLIIGGFPVYIGADYGAGKHVRRAALDVVAVEAGGCAPPVIVEGANAT